VTKPKKVVFCLDPEKVLENDIVLLFERVWGHAALCRKSNELFEAMPEGLHRRLVVATFVERRDRIHVLRPKQALGVNDRGKRVADYAEDLYGNAYALGSALSAALGIPQFKTEGTYFCSQMIARIFIDYGVDLLPGKRPERVLPIDFVSSLALQPVTDQCLREINPITQRSDYEMLMEVAEAAKCVSREMAMIRRVFKTCMKRLGKYKPKEVYSIQELWRWLGTRALAATAPQPDLLPISELERLILESMQQGGYWDFYKGVHLKSVADLDSLKRETQNVPNNDGNLDGVDSWLQFHKATAFSLGDRRKYVQAFRDWQQCTNLELFRRLAENFEMLAHDIENNRTSHQSLKAVRQLEGGGV
jgi:hypothetical protein